jgi:GMP synthase-like glutamine amidotransferase
MKITILEAGRVPRDLRASYPEYPAMFRSLLSAQSSSLTFENVTMCEGRPAPRIEDTEAVLITGSPAAAYDPEPWINAMENFIRASVEAKTPIVGICFGHQIIAQALGGRVERSEHGWGLGRQVYQVLHNEAWMTPASPQFAISASHRDQVVALPPHARTIAQSKQTRFAALAYDLAPVISFQGHPEIEFGFLQALIRLRRGDTIDQDVADAALRGLGGESDAPLIGTWILNFFRMNAPSR